MPRCDIELFHTIDLLKGYLKNRDKAAYFLL
jgi:hypothetical protein